MAAAAAVARFDGCDDYGHHDVAGCGFDSNQIADCSDG